MLGSRTLILFVAWSLLALAGTAPSVGAAELLAHPDLPPGVLYPSGAGDLNAAWMQPVSGTLLNPAFDGDEYLRVKTGTVLNSGSTYGGVLFCCPTSL